MVEFRKLIIRMNCRMASMNRLLLLAILFVAGIHLSARADNMEKWKSVLSDSGTKDWNAQWFLDGDKSTVANTKDGMVLKSGPIEGGDASHAVLWTKQSFSGDIRVEYDFTRLDSNKDHVSVCIFYLQATGTGKAPHVPDIFQWRDLRKVPTMSLYYNFMNCYHFSYACTGGKDFNYVRARRYPAKGSFDADTRIEPSYDKVDLFKPGETWHMVFQKLGTDLSFTATRGDDKHTWTWDASKFPPVAEGRLGLRQMRGRESRYANFEVSTR